MTGEFCTSANVREIGTKFAGYVTVTCMFEMVQAGCAPNRKTGCGYWVQLLPRGCDDFHQPYIRFIFTNAHDSFATVRAHSGSVKLNNMAGQAATEVISFGTPT